MIIFTLGIFRVKPDDDCAVVSELIFEDYCECLDCPGLNSLLGAVPQYLLSTFLDTFRRMF